MPEIVCEASKENAYENMGYCRYNEGGKCTLSTVKIGVWFDEARGTAEIYCASADWVEVYPEYTVVEGVRKLIRRTRAKITDLITPPYSRKR